MRLRSCPSWRGLATACVGAVTGACRPRRRLSRLRTDARCSASPAASHAGIPPPPGAAPRRARRPRLPPSGTSPYGELAAAVDGLAAWLVAARARRRRSRRRDGGERAGDGRGDVRRVGLGAVGVPISVRSTAEEAARLLTHARAARAALRRGARRRRARRPRRRPALPPFVCRARTCRCAPRIVRRAARAGAPRAPRAPRPDDLAVLAYTSGTTGAPEGRDDHARQPAVVDARLRAARAATRRTASAPCLSPLTHTPVLRLASALPRARSARRRCCWRSSTSARVLDAVERFGITDLPLIGGMVFDVVALGEHPARGAPHGREGLGRRRADADGREARAGAHLRRRRDHRGLRPDRVDRRRHHGARHQRLRSRRAPSAA